MEFQTSVACYLSAVKLQELQRPANVVTDEHSISKSPHGTSESVPLLPANSCGNSNNVNDDSNAVVTDSPNNTCSSTNSSISHLNRNSGNVMRTLVVNGTLQLDSAQSSKVSSLVNGPISLLKDKQVCVSSLTNLSQQNGEFKCSSNNSNNNFNHLNNNNNNNNNIQEDTNIASAQCQKTCAGFGGTVIHHSNNNSGSNNNNNNNNNCGNKCVGGTTNQILATKVVKPG